MTAKNGPCRTKHKDKAGLNQARQFRCCFTDSNYRNLCVSFMPLQSITGTVYLCFKLLLRWSLQTGRCNTVKTWKKHADAVHAEWRGICRLVSTSTASLWSRLMSRNMMTIIRHYLPMRRNSTWLRRHRLQTHHTKMWSIISMMTLSGKCGCQF